MNAIHSIPIVIIAGGTSQRLRHHLPNIERKWQLPFGDGSLLDFTLSQIKPLSSIIAINSTHADESKFAAYHYPFIADSNDFGPLSGLQSALKWGMEHNHSQLITLPCDTPFVGASLIKQLYSAMSLSHQRAVISRTFGRLHPLCGVWSTELYQDLSRFLASNAKKSAQAWAGDVAEVIDLSANGDNKAADKSDFDPLMNINTPADYQYALSLLSVR